MIKDFNYIRDQLLQMEQTFDYQARIESDPVRFVRRFSEPADLEVAGLISAVFAYGSVKIIIKTLERIFSVLGESPARFIEDWLPSKKELFPGFYHRFNNAADLHTLLWTIGMVRRKWGSLEDLFVNWYNFQDVTLKDVKCKIPATPNFFFALNLFCLEFLNISADTPFSGTRNFQYFFPSPRDKSPCKRLCLFLRWMNRRDQVDPGGWTRVKKSDLIIPVDAHIQRIARYLGFTGQRNPSWKMAVEITENLKKLDPEDPLRFDFLLCHLGISGECPLKADPSKCAACPAKEFCIGVDESGR